MTLQPSASIENNTQLIELQEKLNHFSSARGSHVDRPIISNTEGQFSLSPSLLFYFDYFLSLRSEFYFEHIIKLISHDIKSQYPVNFQTEILRLFIQYSNYKTQFAISLEALTDHDMQYFLSHPNHYHELKESIQQQFFSLTEIEGLFAEYEASLSMPSQAAESAQKYQQYQYEINQEGQSNAYDAATLNRLEQLKQKRLQWSQRLYDYALQRDAILSSTGLDKISKNDAILTLQARSFTELEQRRVQAYDRRR